MEADALEWIKEKSRGLEQTSYSYFGGTAVDMSFPSFGRPLGGIGQTISV